MRKHFPSNLNFEFFQISEKKYRPIKYGDISINLLMSILEYKAFEKYWAHGIKKKLIAQ